MTIEIPIELKNSLLAAIDSGRFASLDDAMAEAVRILLRDQSTTTTSPPREVVSLAQEAPTTSNGDVSKAQKAIALLDSWLSDESGYDEATWPDLKKALDENRPSSRKLFEAESGTTPAA